MSTIWERQRMLFMNENGTETVDELNYRGKWYRCTITRITLFTRRRFLMESAGMGRKFKNGNSAR